MFLVLAAMFHMVATISHLYPSIGVFSKTPKYFQVLFQQRWNFFSPIPGGDDIDFVYRCNKGKWKEPNKKTLAEHQRNRLLGLGRILYLYKGLAEETYKIYETSYVSCQKSHDECRKESILNVFLSEKFKHIDKLMKDYCPKKVSSGYRFFIKINRYGQNKSRSDVYLKFPEVSYQ